MINLTIPQERILHRIVVLRNEKVMLDIHLAELYDVETRILKQSVKRNLDLFPEDFMFTLTEEEIDLIVSQNIISSKQHLGGSRPFAFTETGVAMLSSVLKSSKAKEINITIMRTFIALRKVALNYTEILHVLDEIQNKINDQDGNIELIFDYLRKIEEEKDQDNTYHARRKIGFKQEDQETKPL